MKSKEVKMFGRTVLAARLAVLAGTLGMITAAGTMRAQQDQPQRDQQQRGQYAGMERIAGEVTGVSGSTVTVKTEDDQTRQIVTTVNTRIMRSRAAAKLTDLKVGDGVVAVGNLDGPNGTLHAAMLYATDAAQVKAMRDNLGKTYIAGKVTAIDMTNATITVERPDHVVQTIGLDETTSFKRGVRPGTPATAGAAAGTAPAASTESITLADIKIGDNVRGIGALKSGVFVPAELIILPPGSGRRRSMEATPPPA